MPICNVLGNLILNFGHGDILVGLGRLPSKPYEDELVFRAAKDPRPVGGETEWEVDPETGIVEPPLIMIFDTVESLDVVANALAQLRQIMVDGKRGEQP